MNEIKNPFLAVRYLIDEGVYLEIRDQRENLWVITKDGNVWERELREWVWEPFPSNRTDDFINKTRMPYWEAINEAIELFKMKASI